jgi:hypothetical protein
MIGSSILLICSHCKNKIGSINPDPISNINPESIIEYITISRLTFLCPDCSCEHEFLDNDDNLVNLLDTGQRNTIAAERDLGSTNTVERNSIGSA